jgi:hypothetical protein
MEVAPDRFFCIRAAAMILVQSQTLSANSAKISGEIKRIKTGPVSF